MTITPFEQFKKSYKVSALIPVQTEILADLDTPVSTFLKATKGSFRFLLESVEGTAQRGRYSILGDSPIAVFKSKNHHSWFRNHITDETIEFDINPFTALQKILKSYTQSLSSEMPFLSGGMFGYLGYDSVRFIENLPDNVDDDTDLDDIHLFIPRRIIVFDNLLNKIHIIQFVHPNGTAQGDYKRAVDEIEKTIENIRTGKLPSNIQGLKRQQELYSSNLCQTEYEEMVKKAKDYIKRGDIFQVVLSQRLKVDSAAHPFNIYRALRVINPSPYMFYMEMGDATLLGSSPETLVKLHHDKVYVKPIAGTCKRGVSDEEDNTLIVQLLSDPKEKAEHMMLVDLGRNDIGRIAKYGTVKVDEFMTIEKYSHVIHIVSTVSGSLNKDMDAVDVFKACFPAGTVSGAPKVRAMEIIDELEPTRRGIYAGATGYFSFDGNMDVCIAIRTIYIKNNSVYLQAGAGIVADSVPHKEYEETMNKANGLLKAVEYTEEGLL